MLPTLFLRIGNEDNHVGCDNLYIALSSSEFIFVAAFEENAAKLKLMLPQLGNLLAVDNITLIFTL